MKKEEELKTILVLSLATLILFLIFKLKVFIFICLGLLIVALFIPKLSLLIAKGWMAFAHFLGKVKDFFDKKETSYFKDVNKKYEKKDLEQLW